MHPSVQNYRKKTFMKSCFYSIFIFYYCENESKFPLRGSVEASCLISALHHIQWAETPQSKTHCPISTAHITPPARLASLGPNPKPPPQPRIKTPHAPPPPPPKQSQEPPSPENIQVQQDADLREDPDWEDHHPRGGEQRHHRQCQGQDPGQGRYASALAHLL